MSQLIAQSNINAVIGMGITGRSVARYFYRKNIPFVWLDTRDEPPGIDGIRQQFPDVPMELGELNLDTLLAAAEIVVSPGVPMSTPVLQAAVQQGATVIGDIDLFLREAKAPLAAVTGSNAKSTVTTLVGEMAKAAGIHVAVGGNLGVPVLELLGDDVQWYVLELSSFQLETINHLGASVACVLNVSEDHMDRYPSLVDYHRAKQRVYFGAKTVVFNRDDPLTAPPMANDVKYLSFGLSAPDRQGFGVINSQGDDYLAHEFKPLLAVSDVRMPGRHNTANALAALAIGYGMGLPVSPMLEVLEMFSGLPHRCQWIALSNEVNWYNDSKATNVGAALAAIKGLSADDGKIVLIAGGVGKGADFTPLEKQAGDLRAVVVIGVDGPAIVEVMQDHVHTEFAGDLQEAVSRAKALSQPGDTVLLSPACASFDMFKGFEDRGDQFEQCVREVLS